MSNVDLKEAFLTPLKKLAGMDELKKDYEKYPVCYLATGCIDVQKPQFVSAVALGTKLRLFVTADEVKAREYRDDFLFYGTEALYYPAKDAVFWAADTHGSQIVEQRILCVQKILEYAHGTRRDKRPLTIVTTIDGLADFLPAPGKYLDRIIRISKDETINIEELSRNLMDMGYVRRAMAELPGQFSVRGGIFDVFSFTETLPVRVDFWGDEVDSIQSYDPDSQRSIEKLEEARIFPATECLLDEDEKSAGLERVEKELKEQLKGFGIDKKKKTKEDLDAINNIRAAVDTLRRTEDYSKFQMMFDTHMTGLLSYFPKDRSLIIFDDPGRLKERMELVEYEVEDSVKNRLTKGYILPGQAKFIRSYKQIVSSAAEHKILLLSTLDTRPEGFKDVKMIRADAKSIATYNNSFEYLADDLAKYERKGYASIVVCNSRSRMKRVAEDLREFGRKAYIADEPVKFVEPGTVLVTYGSIHGGYEYPSLQFVVITENDIFTRRERKRRKVKKEYSGKNIASFNELSIGDYVVQEDKGIGIYRGITKQKSTDGAEKDYMEIDYADGKYYVLATGLDRVQKYAGGDTEKKPKLNKLTTQDWNRTKSRVKGAVSEIAEDLVKLYAVRQQEEGYAFDPDNEWQREFEEMFPYEETGDQLAAITDVKRDMESRRIMDRLICGDVGFGKTEIAIRAAFKAVQDGKQVAFLVPTTILAQQHVNNFKQRMKDFPITVEEMSSFRTAKQNKETAEKLSKGLVDIVIGTHRLLSKDVAFKDLGLLIVDEEQRFGVTHKEKIKALRKNVDVLTLSATPIPRTLHMSLAGIRDMSVLEEPPVDRLPVQTFVTEQDDEIIREAIKREMARGGQIYYVYNRVQSIDEIAMHIQDLVPEANVVYAHGQMEKRRLEHIMSDFINGEIDVLVSTTIIETGMDISNCNTIIIEDAEKFGLSQLYQLRGRVGRTNRTAYAFLLYRRDKMLKEVAEKRLSTIREFSDLGSGFKVAMKDLEIRGAGSVLGRSQHGHMARVGYDLYCKMLNSAVNELKGVKNEYEFETKVEVAVDAFLPSSYIPNEQQKLEVYKRIAAIESMDELEDMRDELTDRFGEIPESTNHLLYISLMRAIAHKIGITQITGKLQKNAWVTRLDLAPTADIDGDAISDFIDMFGGSMVFAPGTVPALLWKVTTAKYESAIDYLSGCVEMLDICRETLTNNN